MRTHICRAAIVRLVAFAGGLAALAAPGFTSSPAAAQQKDTLTAAFAAESTVLDPAKYSAGVDIYFIGQMFEQLVKFSPDLKPENWLAESWSLQGTAEKPVIDIRIRPNVRFHNGDPLTSADFEFAWQRLKDPKISRWSHLQANVERFEIVNDMHFRLHFSAPDGDYIAGGLQLWAIPKKYFEQVGEEQFGRAPVGTGPWKFVSRTVKDHIRFEAFDGYWNKEIRPSVRNLVIKVIPEDLTRVAAFKSGAVDWIDAVPLADVESIKKLSGVKTFSSISGNNLYLDYPAYQPNSPFNKLKVRQAIAHAVDMDAIIDKVLFRQGERYEQVGRGTIGYSPELKPYPYDPRKARQLLVEAGYPNGFETPCYNLTTPREPNIKEYGEAVFAYLSASGIRCRVQGLEYAAWINLGRRGRSGPPEMDGIISWMWAHGLPGDPAASWAGHLHSFVAGQGWGSYSNTDDKKADELTKQLRATMDLEKRAALIQLIAQYAHENVLGGVPTYRPVVTFAWRDTINYTPWPGGGWHNFQQIGFAK